MLIENSLRYSKDKKEKRKLGRGTRAVFKDLHREMDAD